MNIATRYLGLDLCSPFVVGASPFCDSAYLYRTVVQSPVLPRKRDRWELRVTIAIDGVV